MALPKQPRIIFITGTDTGVGKTLLTGLLLHHRRQSGRPAWAMKPFYSGGRADVRFLSALQDGELTDDEISPFYFSEPVAPLISARKLRRRIELDDVLARIHALVAHLSAIKNQKSKIKNPPTLLIEGSGGLLVPPRKQMRRKALATMLIFKLAMFLCAAAGFSSGTNSFFQFVPDQGERRYTNVPHEVLALYYGWFMGGKWNRIDAKTQQALTSVREPVKHQYDSHAPDTIDWQIENARAHGITCFVLSWRG